MKLLEIEQKKKLEAEKKNTPKEVKVRRKMDRPEEGIWDGEEDQPIEVSMQLKSVSVAPVRLPRPRLRLPLSCPSPSLTLGSAITESLASAFAGTTRKEERKILTKTC